MSDTTLAPPTEVDQLRQLFQHVMELPGQPRPDARLRRIRDLAPDPAAWRRLLSAIPLDEMSFRLDVGFQRSSVIKALSGWCCSFKTGRRSSISQALIETHGYLSVLLLTIITMEQARPNPAGQGHDCANVCHPLLRDAGVSAALVSLYEPAPEERQDDWTRIEPDTLRFHRHGSTSFILSGQPLPSTGRRIKFALKCVLFPYSNIPAIASMTRDYAAEHNSLDVNGNTVTNMVHVWASTSRWILMDFADGNTLAEEIQRIKQDPGRTVLTWGGKKIVSPAGNVRLDLLRKLGLPLLNALAELQERDKRHEDLSPSNIIVRRRPAGDPGLEYDVTFVDFGRNYLYIGAVGALNRPESVFVAPEVQGNADDTTRADLYSLGRILITLGDVGQNSDGTIPDRFYGQTPLISRFIEDLIDERPEFRLLVFAMAQDNPNAYRTLCQVLEQELDVAQAELVEDAQKRRDAVPSDQQSLAAMARMVFQPSREPAKRKRLYRLRKEQGVLDDPRRSMYARWLLVFSRIASINFYITLFVPFYWFLRDIGIDILNPADELVLKVIGARPDFIPLIDNLRASDYHLGLVGANLPARIIGFSFALMAIRYYQNIFGGLTTLVARSPAMGGAGLLLSTECAMRVMAIWSSWLILGANLVEVRWWPLATAIGYTGGVVSNVLSARFAGKYLKLAREHKLSTVPPEHQAVTGLAGFRQWGVTLTVYSCAVWTIGSLIYVGILKDVYVYAAAVFVVNVGLLYLIKTGVGAPEVRTGLNRCFLAAERLRYEADRRSGLRTAARPEHTAIVVSRS